MTETIRPLTNSQKLFLQRLLAAHVLTDEKAKDLYKSIREKFANVNNDNDEDSGDDEVDQGYMGDNFEHCLGIINASLIPAFNLEIATVSLPAPYSEDKKSTKQQDEEDGGRKSSPPPLIKYHAIVNRSCDDVAKNYAAARTALGPHEIAYFRKVLEKMVESGNEFLQETQQQQQQGSRKRNRIPMVGCMGKLCKMDVINLRTELEDAHKNKLSIAQTESALEIMESEGWLVPSAAPCEEDEEDSDNDDNQHSKRKRKPSRKSLRAAFFAIGPRSFMELGDFLVQCGFPEERMPQSILHRT